MKKHPRFIRTEPDPEREPLFFVVHKEQMRDPATVAALVEMARCAAKAGSALLDPPTSDEAAERVERSDRAGTHRKLCMEAVLRRPGMTGAEVARETGLERHEASRRLPELRRAGLVRCGDPRICEVRGTKQVSWWPTS